MATGIPLLDNIINGVNTAVNTATNIYNGFNKIAVQTTQQASNQLANFVSGINSGIAATTTAVQQQVYPPTPSYQLQNYQVYNPQPVSLPTQYTAPQMIVPTYAQQFQPSGYTIPGFDLNAILQSISNLSLNSFNANNFFNGVNAFFSNLPSILNLINNPLANPLTSQLIALIQNLYNQQSQTTTLLQQIIQKFENGAYQSTSNILSSIGIDVGGWGNILDATVRNVMEAIGYDGKQKLDAISQMIQQGQQQQNNAIFATQNSLNSFIQQVQSEFTDNAKTLAALGQAVGATIPPPPLDLIQSAVDSAGKELQTVLASIVTDVTKNPQNFINQLSTRIDSISDVIEHLKQGKYHNSTELFNALFGNDTSSGLARGLIILASIIPTLISAVNLAGSPALEAFNYLVNADNPVKLLGINEYLTAYYKGVIQFGELKSKLAKLGIGETELKNLLLLNIEEPPLNFMINGVRRGFVSDDYWQTFLTDQRIGNVGKEMMTKLLNEIPGPSDLTRIADKRVWGLTTAPKYGQYSELPDEYIKFMKQWGFDEQFTRWLWAAHWQLPSPQQVFEMVHRGLLTTEDKDTYLGLTDWLPFFRDKIFDITYNVLTRVDVRRLYKQGLLNDSELHAQHLKMGYTEDDARRLDAYTKQTQLPEDETEFTSMEKRVKNAVEKGYSSGRIDRNEALSMLRFLGVSDNLANQELNILDFEISINNVEPTQKSLQQGAISVIRAAYKKGNISRQDASNYLIASGYGQSEADQELYFLDLENTIRLKSMAQDTVQKLFATYEIDDVELHNRLNTLGFSAREVEIIYQESLLMRDNRTKKLTPTQLQKLFKTGVITVDDYANQLKGLGYTDQSVFWLVSQELPAEGSVQ